MNTIFTAGYSVLSPDALTAMAKARDLLVLDIRFRAGSRKADWNKSALISRLGERYLHIRELGNEAYRSGNEVKFLNAELGLQRAADALAQKSVLLLCTCSDVETCHRKVASELLSAQTGAPVIHLAAADFPQG